jgi:hypothetical protein
MQPETSATAGPVLSRLTHVPVIDLAGQPYELSPEATGQLLGA